MKFGREDLAGGSDECSDWVTVEGFSVCLGTSELVGVESPARFNLSTVYRWTVVLECWMAGVQTAATNLEPFSLKSRAN